MARTKQNPRTRKEIEDEVKAARVEKVKKDKEEHAAMVDKGKKALEGLKESGVSLEEMRKALGERFKKTLDMDPPACNRKPTCYADPHEYTVSIARGAIDGPPPGPLSIDPELLYDDQLEYYEATTNLDGFKGGILETVHMSDEEKEDVERYFDEIDEMMDDLREYKQRFAERFERIIDKNFAVWEAEGLGK